MTRAQIGSSEATVPFALRLKAIRVEASISVTALAERAGINRSALNKLEAGLSLPTLDTARRLAAALHALGPWKGKAGAVRIASALGAWPAESQEISEKAAPTP